MIRFVITLYEYRWVNTFSIRESMVDQLGIYIGRDTVVSDHTGHPEYSADYYSNGVAVADSFVGVRV